VLLVDLQRAGSWSEVLSAELHSARGGEDDGESVAGGYEPGEVLDATGFPGRTMRVLRLPKREMKR